MEKSIWMTLLAWVMSFTTPEMSEEGCRRSTSRIGRCKILFHSSFRARSVTFSMPYSPQIFAAMEIRAVSTVSRA